MRPIDEDTVVRLAESIDEIGLQAQGMITVEWAPIGAAQPAILVSGRHRLEALRRLGWERVPCVIFDGPANEAELWRVAENLHRKELTVLERAEAIARWMELTKEKHAQAAHVSGGRGHRGGISAAAEELGVNRRTIQRGLQIAGLSDEAKTVAVRLDLADNSFALTKAAHAGAAAEQVASLEDEARKRDRLRSPEMVARRREQAMRTWETHTDWYTLAAEQLYDWLGQERSEQFLAMLDKGGLGTDMAAAFAVAHLQSLVCEKRNTSG